MAGLSWPRRTLSLENLALTNQVCTDGVAEAVKSRFADAGGGAEPGEALCESAGRERSGACGCWCEYPRSGFGSSEWIRVARLYVMVPALGDGRPGRRSGGRRVHSCIACVRTRPGRYPRRWGWHESSFVLRAEHWQDDAAIEWQAYLNGVALRIDPPGRRLLRRASVVSAGEVEDRCTCRTAASSRLDSVSRFPAVEPGAHGVGIGMIQIVEDRQCFPPALASGIDVVACLVEITYVSKRVCFACQKTEISIHG